MAGGASDYHDPNPVEPEHVLNQMRSNFPEDKITWVKRTKWTGPVDLPWDRVDTDDIGRWAASHQQPKVNEFKKQLRQDPNSVAPSIMVQEAGHNRGFLVDGHHRALARKQLNMPVRAYLGNINSNDRLAALETHSSQLHQGSSSQNKSAETPELSTTHAPIGHEGLWHSKHPPLQLPAYIQNIRNALMRAGHGEQEAHALAVAAVERWAKGDLKWGPHRKVTPEVQAASQRAVAEWEKLRADHP